MAGRPIPRLVTAWQYAQSNSQALTLTRLVSALRKSGSSTSSSSEDVVSHVACAMPPSRTAFGSAWRSQFLLILLVT